MSGPLIFSVMTYEINDAFNQIIINSDNFDNTNQSVKLTVVVNCSTSKTITIPVVDTLIELEPSDLGQTDVFSESPYYFKLEIVQADGTVITEYMCKYIQPDECAYLDLLSDKKNMDKILALTALQTLNSCERCSCSDACLFYSILTDSNCNDCTCGCS